MENPATWGRAEHVVNDAIHEHETGIRRGAIGLSLNRTITDALRKAGLLRSPGPPRTSKRSGFLLDGIGARVVTMRFHRWLIDVRVHVATFSCLCFAYQDADQPNSEWQVLPCDAHQSR